MFESWLLGFKWYELMIVVVAGWASHRISQCYGCHPDPQDRTNGGRADGALGEGLRIRRRESERGG